MEKVDYTGLYRWLQYLTNVNLKGSKRLTMIISGLLLPKSKKNGTVIKTIYGFYLMVNPVKDKGIERSLYYLGTYEPGTLNIMRHLLSDGDVFIDVGANIGLMTIFSSLLVGTQGKVFSFEANPETKKILDYNLKLNNITNTVTSGYALGSEKGNGKIYTNWHINRGGASLIQSEKSTDYFPVEIIRLDQFPGLSSTIIKLIKIDIEGYEFEALKGCGEILKSPEAPMLIIECSNAGQNFEPRKGDIFQYLKNMNSYRFFKLKKGSHRVSSLEEITHPKQAAHHSNIFCFPDKRISTLSSEIF